MRPKELSVQVASKRRRVIVDDNGIVLDGVRIEGNLTPLASGTFVLTRGMEKHNVYVKRTGDDEYEIWIKHHVFEVVIEDSRHQLLKRFAVHADAGHATTTISAPMPGLVTKLQVREGENVEAGAPLMILEAMKMENEIRAKVKGKVKKIEVRERTSVEKGQRLIILESL